MQFTQDVLPVMMRHGLTEPMAHAVHNADPGEIIDCHRGTDTPLVDRGTMHHVNSELTTGGPEIRAARTAPQGVVASMAPTVEPLGGGIVTHVGFALGSLPVHAVDPDVRAALDALLSLERAQLSDDFDSRQSTAVRGVMVEPRGSGRVAVHWLEGGHYRDRDPLTVQLDMIGERPSAGGWTVEKQSLFWVFAWRSAGGGRPAIVQVGPTVRTPRGDKGIVTRLPMVGTEARATTSGVDRPAFGVKRVTAAPASLPIPESGGRNTRTAPGLSAACEATSPATDAFLAESDFWENEPPALAREVRDANGTYAVEHRKGDEPWRLLFTTAIDDADEVRDLVADLEELAEPGVEFQAVEVHRIDTVLPRQASPKPLDVDHGPVKARKLRTGDRVDLYGDVRLVRRVEHRSFDNSLLIRTVPPYGESPDYFSFTKSPNETIELVSRGPALDVTGRPVDTTH